MFKKIIVSTLLLFSLFPFFFSTIATPALANPGSIPRTLMVIVGFKSRIAIDGEGFEIIVRLNKHSARRHFLPARQRAR